MGWNIFETQFRRRIIAPGMAQEGDRIYLFPEKENALVIDEGK
jgi:hypothetical protein